MRRSRAAAMAALAASILSAGLVLFSCAFIDLRGFPVTTWPAVPEAVLDAAPTVWVQFPEPVDYATVEPFLSVAAAGRRVAGDMSWDQERLTFTPVKPFGPGVRYTLRLEGTVRTTAGRSFSEQVTVPFYVGTDDPPPIISSQAPPDGGVVDCLATLTLRFSTAMDPAVFKDVFSISPTVAFTVSWNAEATAATIAPTVRWNAQTLYTWTLATGCTSAVGVALERAWSATFLVQSDVTSPTVLAPGRALVNGSSVTTLPGGLSDLQRGDSVLLSFSEDVDAQTLQSAFSLSPSVTGSLVKIQPALFAFVPSADWSMAQEYVLTISTDLKDLAGNPLPSRFREVFTPAIPVQTVTEIDLVGDLQDSPAYLASNGDLNNTVPYVLHWTVGAPPDNALVLTITLHFSQPYDDAHKATVASAIRLAATIPSTLMSPQVTGVVWPGPQTVSISYIGFRRSENSPSLEKRYYTLSVTPGLAQTGNQNGSFIQSPVTLVVESGSDS